MTVKQNFVHHLLAEQARFGNFLIIFLDDFGLYEYDDYHYYHDYHYYYDYHYNPFDGLGLIPYRFSPYAESAPRVVVMNVENFWTQWSDCSTTCGGGKQTRTRECYVDSAAEGSSYDCQFGGQEVETRNCYLTDCQIWGVWSSWSDCDAPCNGGKRKRVRDCSNAEDYLGLEARNFFHSIGRPDLICDGITTVSLIFDYLH